MTMFVTVASGFSTSSAFFLSKPSRFVALHCASAAAATVTVEFSARSGTAPFAVLKRPDGSGGAFLATTSAEGWVVLASPTPFGRVTQSPAATDTRTFTLTLAW